jgi:hypothetical protein
VWLADILLVLVGALVGVLAGELDCAGEARARTMPRTSAAAGAAAGTEDRRMGEAPWDDIRSMVSAGVPETHQA